MEVVKMSERDCEAAAPRPIAVQHGGNDLPQTRQAHCACKPRHSTRSRKSAACAEKTFEISDPESSSGDAAPCAPAARGLSALVIATRMGEASPESSTGARAAKVGVNQ